MSAWSQRIAIARRIAGEEGWGPLLRRGAAHLWHHAWAGGRYYVCEHDLRVVRDEADFRPRVDKLEVRVVRTNAEADALPAGWDPRPFFLTGRRRLGRGATAFCLYVDGEFAHAGWTAESAVAKSLMDCIPYRVDFEHGEACTGGTWTRPKYRGLGLMGYSYFLRLDYLRRQGFVRSRNAVEVNNVASLRAHARFGARRCAIGRYVRIGGWEWWRERPLTTPT